MAERQIPQKGEAGVIEGTEALLPYLDDLATDLLQLAGALGQAKNATAIIEKSESSICMKIFMSWMVRQAPPTWQLLYEQLQFRFEGTASAIKRDHCITMEEIKDVSELMKYINNLVGVDMKELGSALGISKQAEAILKRTQGSVRNNCLTILGDYISCTGHCTWKKFYDRLKPCPDFAIVAHRIKEDHNIVDEDIPQQNLPQNEVPPQPQPQQEHIVQENRDEPDGGIDDQPNEYHTTIDIN